MSNFTMVVSFSASLYSLVFCGPSVITELESTSPFDRSYCHRSVIPSTPSKGVPKIYKKVKKKTR